VKRSSIRFSDLAVADLLEQADWYASQSGLRLTKRWDKAVTATLLRISAVPGAGTLCRFKADQLQGTRRMLIAGFPRHLIFYQIEPEGILVLRVVHGARDLEPLFSA
jgi:toxin ParE1/3/4